MHVSFQYSHFDVAKQGALGHIAHLNNNNSQLWLYICTYFSTVSLKLPFKVKYYHYLNQYFRKVIIVKKILPIVLYI